MRTTIQAGFGSCGKWNSLYGVEGSEGQIQFYLKIKKSCVSGKSTHPYGLPLTQGIMGFINPCNDFKVIWRKKSPLSKFP